MLDFLKQTEEKAQDIKTLRHGLLVFIKEQLQKAEGGEGNSIKGLQLFLTPADEEKHLFESAVYYHEPNRFKEEEVQKIADDYAIELPKQWQMEFFFTDNIPAHAIKSKNLPIGLSIITRKHQTANKITTAVIKVLNGEAESEQYNIASTAGKVYIGRGKNVQTANGFYRVNTIAFLENKNEGNRFVSRQHAHIEWNEKENCFLLFADDGGVPPKNKIKIQTGNGSLIKLQTTQIGHCLQHGDQIILGESALLEFNFQPEGSI